MSSPLLLDATSFEEPTTERDEREVPYAGSKRPEQHAQPTIAAPGPKFAANRDAPDEVPHETLQGARRHPAILARLCSGRPQPVRRQMQTQRLPLPEGAERPIGEGPPRASGEATEHGWGG